MLDFTQKQIERFRERAQPITESGCWVWMGAVQSSGYGHLKINGRYLLAHRVSYMMSAGQIPDGLHVLHKCDNRVCVNPTHLFLGDRFENMQDMISKGRGKWPPKRGEQNGNTSLKECDVIDLREKFEIGVSRAELARIFNIGWSSVDRIVKRKVWSHI